MDLAMMISYPTSASEIIVYYLLPQNKENENRIKNENATKRYAALTMLIEHCVMVLIL